MNLAGRSEAKIKPVMEQIKEVNPKIDLMIVPLDLSKQHFRSTGGGDYQFQDWST
jgi:hypothetical protein